MQEFLSACRRQDAADRDATGFCRMLELPVTSFSDNAAPTVRFDPSDHIPHFHFVHYSRRIEALATFSKGLCHLVLTVS